MSNLNDVEIFAIAAELSGKKRDEFLKQASGGDGERIRRIEQMLLADEQTNSLLDEVPNDNSLASTTEALTKGKHPVIGNYKLLHKLGEGGFGVVYMAEQVEPVRRKVALKIVKAERIGDATATIARFEAERQALAMMDHPNIAKVFDGGAIPAGTDLLTETLGVADRPFFVMELVNGVPITEYCDKNNLPNRERLELFVSVCLAVQHAHQKGVIHRDLKPSNILVTLHDGKPVVKVIDFGVAKAINQQLTEKTLYTVLGDMIGTPLYMSPEQAERSGLDIDTRSDIYSLGVLLYELLTGTTPLTAKELKEAGILQIQKRILESEPPKPSTRLSTSGNELTVIAKHRSITPDKLSREIRGDLDWIVMKALDKDRSRRYDTAKGFANDVERFLNDDAITARPPSNLYLFRKFARRYKGSVRAVLALIISLSFGLLSTLYFYWKLEQSYRDVDVAKETAVASQVKAEDALRESIKANYAFQIESAFRALEMGSLDRLRERLEACRPADPNGEDLRGFEWRLLAQKYLENFPAQTREFDAEVVDVKFTPDMSAIAALLSDGNLFLSPAADLAKGRTFVTGLNPANRLGGDLARLQFSSDGKLHVLGRRADTESGRRIIVTYEILSGGSALRKDQELELPFVASDLSIGDNDRILIGGNGRSEDALSWTRKIDPQQQGSQDRPAEFLGRFPKQLGPYLATTSMGGPVTKNLVRLYHYRDEKEIDQIPTGTQPHVAFAPDEKHLLISDSSGMWMHERNGDVQRKRQLSRKRALCMAMIPETSFFVFAGSDNNAVTVVDAQSGIEERRFLHKSRVLKLDVSPDGRKLATGSRDKTLKIWSMDSVQSSAVDRGAAAYFAPLAVARNGETVARLAADNWLVRVINAGRPESFFSFQVENGERRRVLSVSMDQKATLLAANTDAAGRAATIWRIANRRELPLPMEARRIQVSPNGKFLIVQGRERVWSVQVKEDFTFGTPRELEDVSASNSNYHGARFSRDSSMAALVKGISPTIFIVKMDSGSVSSQTFEARIKSVDFSADNRFLAISGYRSEIAQIELGTGEQSILPCRGDWVTCVRYSPDGKTLAAASPNGEIEFWRVPSGRPAGSIFMNRGVRKIEFTPDGNRLYWSSMDGDVGYHEAAPASTLLNGHHN